MVDESYKLWIVELDEKNSWFSYLNYLSLFQISKYMNQFKSLSPLILHTSPQDFPTEHILFINTSKDVVLENIKNQWMALEKPKTLIFPGTSRWLKECTLIDKSCFHMFNTSDSLRK